MSDLISPIELVLQRHWIPIEQQDAPVANVIYVTFEGVHDHKLRVVPCVRGIKDRKYRREGTGLIYESSSWKPLAWMPKWAPKPYQP
jgi:hypothetical protein